MTKYFALFFVKIFISLNTNSITNITSAVRYMLRYIIHANTATIVTFLRVERGTATGVQTLNVKVQNNSIYNLAGQKVAEDYKGMVIKNGKKMMK